MASAKNRREAEQMVSRLVDLVGGGLPELRPVDLGLLIEVLMILQYGSHDARDLLLRNLEVMRRAFPGEEQDGGTV